MPPRMAYIAAPIDQADMNDVVAFGVDHAVFGLLDYGIEVTYSPANAFKVLAAAPAGYEVEAVNGAALDAADCVLAFLPAGVPTIGVPMEIQKAVMTGKPVAVVTDVNSWSLGGLYESDVAVFPLTHEGCMQAEVWLASHSRATERDTDQAPLPFMIVARGQCGKNWEHSPHPFGEHMEEDCDGLPDLTPLRKYDGDAGWDLVVARDTYVGPGQQVDVSMGLAVALPDWSFGRITGRSSTLRKRGLLVNEGIIDSGYRGELFALVRNMTDGGVHIRAGERVAQILVHANESRGLSPLKLDALPASDRGESGFGSTGV